MRSVEVRVWGSKREEALEVGEERRVQRVQHRVVRREKREGEECCRDGLRKNYSSMYIVLWWSL